MYKLRENCQKISQNMEKYINFQTLYILIFVYGYLLVVLTEI